MDYQSSLITFDNYKPCSKFYHLFIEKLIEGNSWSKTFTENAVLEYVKFLKVIKVFGVKQTPSKIVDEVWHVHLQFTKDYWEHLCPNILGFKLHHIPTLKNQESEQTNLLRYEETLNCYRKLFGTPPIQFWGRNEEKMPDKKVKNTILRNQDKNHLQLGVGLTCCIFIIFTLGAPAVTFMSGVSGETFLILYGVILLVSNLLIVVSMSLAKLYDKILVGAWCSICAIILSAFIGVLRMFHGISHGYPIFFLVIEIFFGIIFFPAITINGFLPSDRKRLKQSTNHGDAPSLSSNCTSNSSCSSSSCSSSSCSSGGCGGCGGSD